MDEPGPTDVMSFPMDELDTARRPDEAGPGPALLGDVVLCPAVATEQATPGRPLARRRAAPAHRARRPAPARLRPRRARRGAGDVPAAERTARRLARTAAAAARPAGWQPSTTPYWAPSACDRPVRSTRRVLTGRRGRPWTSSCWSWPPRWSRSPGCAPPVTPRSPWCRRPGSRRLRPGTAAAAPPRCSRSLSDRPRYTNLLLLLRVGAELTATVLVTAVALSTWGFQSLGGDRGGDRS